MANDTATARNIRRVRNRIIGLNEDLAEAVEDARRHQAATGTSSFEALGRQLAAHTALAAARRELTSYQTPGLVAA